MNDLPPPADPAAPDWVAFVRAREAASVPEIVLTSLQPNDRLLLVTERTAYTFVMRGPNEADVTSNRADRPSGRVIIRGCTFGASSSIKPDHVFCGGNLEFTHGDPPQVTTTTTIRALQLVQATPSAAVP